MQLFLHQWKMNGALNPLLTEIVHVWQEKTVLVCLSSRSPPTLYHISSSHHHLRLSRKCQHHHKCAILRKPLLWNQFCKQIFLVPIDFHCMDTKQTNKQTKNNSQCLFSMCVPHADTTTQKLIIDKVTKVTTTKIRTQVMHVKATFLF